MPDKFTIDIDLYERLTALRRAMNLPTSDYLEKIKDSILKKEEFIVNGKVVNVKRGKTCLN